MKIPRTLKIGGETWKIRLVTGFAKRTGKFGYCNPNIHTITIERDMTDHMVGVTFIHELLHAVWPEGLVEAEVEEKLVEILDSRLFAALKRSKII